jgi:hypothetical protein
MQEAHLMFDRIHVTPQRPKREDLIEAAASFANLAERCQRRTIQASPEFRYSVGFSQRLTMLAAVNHLPKKNCESRETVFVELRAGGGAAR